LDDPVARDKLARCEIHVRILGFNAVRSTAALLADGSPGPSASIARLYHSLLEQEFHQVGVELLGQAGLVTGGSGTVDNGRWTTGYLHSRGATIGAGTAEIQRNTIAEHILGLPREEP
jgi:alkylation response protein AidB-like acyl-CoA dehydrogenase